MAEALDLLGDKGWMQMHRRALLLCLFIGGLLFGEHQICV